MAVGGEARAAEARVVGLQPPLRTWTRISTRGALPATELSCESELCIHSVGGLVWVCSQRGSHVLWVRSLVRRSVFHRGLFTGVVMWGRSRGGADSQRGFTARLKAAAHGSTKWERCLSWRQLGASKLGVRIGVRISWTLLVLIHSSAPPAASPAADAVGPASRCESTEPPLLFMHAAP